MGQQTSREMPPEEVHPKHPTEAEMNGPDFDLNDVVALYASERLDAKTFLVSKEFASRYSPVLSAMINEPFPEKENVPEYWSIIEDKSREGVSQESENLESESQAGDNQVGSNEEGESKRIRHVYILGIAEDVLDILVQWIHTQKIDPDQFKEDNEGFREMEPLIRAWIYGDELRMPAFQNSCMEVMIKVKKESRLVILPDLFDVWEKTRKGSPLRRYVVDVVLLIYRIGGDDYLKADGSVVTYRPHMIPTEMMVAMFERARTLISPERSGRLNREASVKHYKVSERN